jgi:protein-tyrosine phosphatase
MIAAGLHWIKGPWPGRLALAARPRGGDWLGDELAAWHREGIDTVVSLLTSEEERELDLSSEERETKAQRMAFRSFPIPDRQVPDSETKLGKLLTKIDEDLGLGKNVVLHCRQGIGRTGLVAACLLVTKGFDVRAAIKQLSDVRGIPIPETPEQRSWIDHYANTLANLK